MDETALPIALVAERNELIQAIDAAFGGVSREGGVSWSESRVVDDNGTAAQRIQARLEDGDRSWRDLVDDESWDPEMGIGGWSFLDAIGFRYYLPAAMTRSLREGFDVGIQFHLTLPRWFLRRHTLQQWSALDAEQRACVGRFLRFMAARELALGYDFEAAGWQRAYRSYWDR